jgi:hypothetical protein
MRNNFSFTEDDVRAVLQLDQVARPSLVLPPNTKPKVCDINGESDGLQIGGYLITVAPHPVTGLPEYEVSVEVTSYGNSRWDPPDTDYKVLQKTDNRPAAVIAVFAEALVDHMRNICDADAQARDAATKTENED